MAAFLRRRSRTDQPAQSQLHGQAGRTALSLASVPADCRHFSGGEACDATGSGSVDCVAGQRDVWALNGGCSDGSMGDVRQIHLSAAR